MANIETMPVGSPTFSAKSLSYRQNRAVRVMQIIRISEPSKLALGLKRIARDMIAVATNRNEPMESRVEAGKLALQCADRLLDLIAHPKRPAATSAKGAARIDLATILEAHPSEGPCTVDPVTEPAKPAESGPSVASDELPPKQ